MQVIVYTYPSVYGGAYNLRNCLILVIGCINWRENNECKREEKRSNTRLLVIKTLNVKKKYLQIY